MKKVRGTKKAKVGAAGKKVSNSKMLEKLLKCFMKILMIPILQDIDIFLIYKCIGKEIISWYILEVLRTISVSNSDKIDRHQIFFIV